MWYLQKKIEKQQKSCNHITEIRNRYQISMFWQLREPVFTLKILLKQKKLLFEVEKKTHQRWLGSISETCQSAGAI